MRTAIGVLAASATLFAGIVTGIAQRDEGDPAPGLVRLGRANAADAPPVTTALTTTATTAPAATAPAAAAPTSTTPPTSAAPLSPPATPADDEEPDHEEVEHDVDEYELDDYRNTSGAHRDGLDADADYRYDRGEGGDDAKRAYDDWDRWGWDHGDRTGPGSGWDDGWSGERHRGSGR